ncbi:type 2 periplasmic-binding domain-containing protein [Arthrobacter monumenti]
MKSRFNSAGRIGVAASSVLALGLLAGCGSGSGSDGGGGGAPEGGNTLEQIKEAGTVKVGIAGEAPYSFLDDGDLKGGSVAIAKEVFAGLGVENVEAELVDWDALIPGLNAGRFDVISAGMSILPERCAEADFSLPTIMYTTALMVEEGNPLGLSDLQSVVNSEEDVQLAVLAGGIESGYAESLGIEGVTSVPDAQTGMDTVANGRADAFAMTAISLNYMADNNPNVPIEVTQAFTAVIDGEEQVGSGATVFRPGDDKLREAYNKELEKNVLADEDTYLGVVGEYGFTAENLPPKDLTTEELCGEAG